MLNDANNANELYDNVIMPYKGALEAWYSNHRSVKLYFMLIIATIYVVLTGRMMFSSTFLSSLLLDQKN